MGVRDGWSSGSLVVATVKHLLLLDRVGNLSSSAKEVKILVNRSADCNTIASKGIIVEIVTGFFKLVAEAVVGVFEIDGIVAITLLVGKPSKRVVSLGKARRGLVVA